MATNFDLIGARIDSEEDLERIANSAAFSPEIITFGSASYLSVRDPAGAEIWFGLDNGALVSANPFFAVGRPVLASIDAVAEPNPELAALEAMLDITLLEAGETVTRATVLTVNVPEAATRASAPGALDLCVFSHETTVFASDADFAAVPREIELAPQSFLPSGMFTEPGRPHRPLGFGAGRVLRAGLAPGAFGGPPYCWAEIDTLGGRFGVVWAPESCPPAEKGQIVAFDGMLVAKALSPFWQPQ